MFEKVNPSHPDKLADRIAGAFVDYAYTKQENPRVAVEVLLGHGVCKIIAESSVEFPLGFSEMTVDRIVGIPVDVDITQVPQDDILANNQSGEIRCGDNGIFRGAPVTGEQRELSRIARLIYNQFKYDGKYIINANRLIICQSHASASEINSALPFAEVNPLGYWEGGIGVDAGATNRKLGSDMADSVTGGGLHGKDLSKADVSLNIYLWLKAQEIGHPISAACAIGDEMIDGVLYEDIVETAREYIKRVGGFEKFAEWGLV